MLDPRCGVRHTHPVSQGHCHPRLVEVMQKQAAELTLTSRAFYNDKLGPFCDYITSYFGFDRVRQCARSLRRNLVTLSPWLLQVLPMNTGVEAVETAMKLCRRWGYDKKRVPPNEVRTTHLWVSIVAPADTLCIR